MGWATQYIDQLLDGQVISFRPVGNSMNPFIESGQLVIVAPVNDLSYLCRNDIVLCEVNDKEYLHFIVDINTVSNLFLIGNAHGRINGWTDKIFGIVVECGE